MDARSFWSPENRPSYAFIQHALAVLALVAAVFLLWRVRDAVLVTFAGVIVAVLVVAATAPLRRWTGMSHRLAVVVAGLLLAALAALVVVLVGSQIRTQVSELGNQLPQAITAAEERLGIQLQDSQSRGIGGGLISSARNFVGQLSSLGYVVAEVVTGLVLVAIAGVFLALDPHLYRRGLVKLFPVSSQGEVDATLGACGVSLRNWLLGELLAMAIVGTLAGLGTWLIGLPAPLALGLFAALTEFVPVVGPIIGAIPALLLALSQGGSALLWTLLLFLAIQQLESNIITPLIQRRMVEIPPALLLFSVLAFGMLFGMLGVVVAGPLTVVAYVAVKRLYVRDTLGEATHVPGEEERVSP